MSGKGSRARRVEATRRAYADVYRLRGAEMPPPPFGNERQDRIYTQQYANYRRSYWHMERMHAELAEVYGYTATPRLRSNNNYIPDSPDNTAIPTGEPGVIRRDVGLTPSARQASAFRAGRMSKTTPAMAGRSER